MYGTRPHVPDYLVQDGRTYRLVTDHLGSVRLVVDVETGDVMERLDYGPFGEVVTPPDERGDPHFQPFGFAGGLWDVDTGLVRFGARDYDPAVGRWTAKDPLWFKGGDTNLYAYVQADPLNATDPTGRDPYGEALADALWLEPEEALLKDKAQGLGALLGFAAWAGLLGPAAPGDSGDRPSPPEPPSPPGEPEEPGPAEPEPEPEADEDEPGNIIPAPWREPDDCPPGGEGEGEGEEEPEEPDFDICYLQGERPGPMPELTVDCHYACFGLPLTCWVLGVPPCKRWVTRGTCWKHSE